MRKLNNDKGYVSGTYFLLKNYTPNGDITWIISRNEYNHYSRKMLQKLADDKIIEIIPNLEKGKERLIELNRR